MKPIRSMVPAAFMLAALAACSPSARAQMGPYGPNVNPYAGVDPAYGGYGQQGYATGYGQGMPTDGFYSVANPYNPAWANRSNRSRSRKSSSRKPAMRPGSHHVPESASTPYSPYEPVRPATISADVKARVIRRGSSMGGYLDPWLPPLHADTPELGRRMPRLDAEDPRLGADLPQLGYGMPQLNSGLPQLGHGMPQLGYGMPQLNAGLPQLGHGMPQLGYGMPQLNAGLPQMGAGMPQLGYAMPHLGVETPRLNTYIPPLGTGLPPIGAARSHP